MDDTDIVRYDLGELMPIERGMLRDRLESEHIPFRIAEDVLFIEAIDESDVDGHIAYVEAYASALHRISTDASLARSGRAGVTRCELCGASPAAAITLRRQTGMIVVRSTHQLSAVLCNSCAATATKSYQTQTALKGWTGVISAVSNPVFLATNAVNRSKHKKKLG